ncbi:Putative uncharacterized protein [Moritella viscosa]|uniref:Uncharacterized protein n=1 Tax=Moritella viscosa TaxID=80854 RepID=A0A090IBB0_9GAMM|nr:hypothetical protein [Moritella viscosa]CED59071.1 putative lipoprotein [Moritella viscosa]SGZ17132.1 Putative uncharacterized protein [Moritella viscosa]SHN99141.1 Putative uncharacterized protein [Moritella viscosa]SHN99144.1 Putative uncharacterized protein [Moritella viscosa]SHN99241.1 Putative uncharacterized protein [Moritella viscosa]
MKKTLVLTMAILLGGCAATDTASTTSSQIVNAQTEQFFEVHKDGRIYLFSDFDLYQDFMQLGHTAYFKAFIGEGPHGETLKFGLTGEQKKKFEGVKHVDLYQGQREVTGPFYGEMFMDNRYYVFSSWADMKLTRDSGEAALRFSDIGAGPDGKTVIYVLNSKNKKQRPDALMAEFKEKHQI